MGRKTYISFKAEDLEYKLAIQQLEGLDYVDKSLNTPIDSDDLDYIMSRIRAEYLYDSTVTLFLIGRYSSGDLGDYEQRFIKKELQASLYNSPNHGKNGILGIVLPDMYDAVFGGKYDCVICGSSHNLVAINSGTVVAEFAYNYYIPNQKCSHTEDERYCVLVKWEEFVRDPEAYIEAAFAKRDSPIASKTRVRP